MAIPQGNEAICRLRHCSCCFTIVGWCWEFTGGPVEASLSEGATVRMVGILIYVFRRISHMWCLSHLPAIPYHPLLSRFSYFPHHGFLILLSAFSLTWRGHVTAYGSVRLYFGKRKWQSGFGFCDDANPIRRIRLRMLGTNRRRKIGRLTVINPEHGGMTFGRSCSFRS